MQMVTQTQIMQLVYVNVQEYLPAHISLMHSRNISLHVHGAVAQAVHSLQLIS